MLMPIRDIITSTPSQPTAPRNPMTEPVTTARTGHVEELVVSPAAIDYLRQYQDERERRDEVGDLIVEQDGLEELPEESRRVQRDAE